MIKARFNFLLLTVMIITVAIPAWGQDPSRIQVSAATANALDMLKAEVRSTRISPTLTVAQFLEKTGASDLFDETIQQAQQIGAPRWIDEQTCQVRLELSGAKAAYALVAIAATRPKVSPIPAAVLEQALDGWKQRSFAGTGSSVSASRAPGIRPFNAGDRWNNVSDEVRSQTIAAARQDAAQHILDDIRPINITNEQTVGDLLSKDAVQQSVRDWIAAQPVTQVRFNDDLQVELTLATPSDQLFATLIDAAKTARSTTVPSDGKAAEDLEREFSRRINGVMGRASAASSNSATQPISRRIVLPDRPPAWIATLLDAQGFSPNVKSVLRTKVAAENNATENLRARIGALSLTRSQTLEDAAGQDQRIADAIGRTLLRARVYKVEYAADGSISVRMTLDARDLWNELRIAVNH